MVRPVGLTDDNARDWLRVAAGEVADIQTDLLEEACAEARRTCTHHGQIIPAIIKHSEDRMVPRRKLAAIQRAAADEAIRRQHQQDLPAPDVWHPSQDEIDEIKRLATRNLRA